MKTTLHYYRFTLPEDREEYTNLRKKLKSMGLECFSSSSPTRQSSFYKEKIKPLDNKQVELDTKYLFNNQWNTTKGSGDLRIFDWSEPIYPNRSIKEGMFLEQTQEMKDIRDNTYKCGYCGHMHTKPTIIFCDKCLDSEYLEESNLHLLRLYSVSVRNKKYPELTPEELDFLMPIYIERQTKGDDSRNAKRLKQKRIDIQQKFDEVTLNAKTEFDGFTWLMDHDINTDNCIYYPHINMFSFGWRNPISEEVKNELIKKLAGFPFNHEFTTE